MLPEPSQELPAPLRARFRGCLLGGAVGDALGAPVEGLSLAEIRARYGPGGIDAMDVAYGRRGALTDDTQLTLFTAEGLIRAGVRQRARGTGYVPAVVHHAYIRWLATQGQHPADSPYRPPHDGWLVGVAALHARRGPGATCLSALASGHMGSRRHPINASKGCGGVMRAAPAGLWATRASAFGLGADTAALTHGHPSGYLAAGFLAQMVACLRDGLALEGAFDEARRRLVLERDHAEVLAAVEAARALAGAGPLTPEAVETLGAGRVAEEALAIAVACAFAARNDFEAGVAAAVNHSGDSDSTGALAGSLLGAALGEAALPARWLDALELRDVVGAVADDLAASHLGADLPWDRYPGW